MIGFTLSTLVSLAPAVAVTPAPQGEAPPGMVLIEGGKLTVGTPLKEAIELIKANTEQGKAIAGETPQHELEIDDFYLMTTEVTNEQYAAYIRATGAKPPHLWGATALDEARRNFLEEQGKAAREASKRGERFTRERFDEVAWWDKNWEDVDWEVPQDLLSHPVTYVDFKGATGYAKWAGLHVMSEFEYYRAARRNSDNRYPWGDKWADGCASNVDAKIDGTSPVGSFPDGAVEGVYDLVGNVWEWTSSSYVGFDGYERVEVKLGRKQTFDAMAPFDPSERVLVGGGFSSSQLATRIATRFATHRTQTTDALGFRCAASAVPGLDAAQAILKDDIDLTVLPDDVSFAAENSVVTRRWLESPGTAQEVEQLVGGKRAKGKVETYRVIDGYDQVLFVPVTKLSGGSTRDLETMTLSQGPVHIGFLTTTIPLVEPALEPGTYHVAWRAGGKPRGDQKDDTFDWASLPGFDEKEDRLVFLDLEATPIAASPVRPMLHDKIRRRGSVKIEPFVPPTPDELKKLEREGQEPPRPLDTVVLNVVVPGKSRGKGFLMDLPLKTDPSVTPKDWRLSE